MEVPDFPPEDLGKKPGALERVKRRFKRRPRRSNGAEIHIDAPAYDEWPEVRSFEDAATARSFAQAAGEAGHIVVLTSDWPLDRFGRGEIALRAAPGTWSEVEEFFSGLDLE
jgi:hypothetical protein